MDWGDTAPELGGTFCHSDATEIFLDIFAGSLRGNEEVNVHDLQICCGGVQYLQYCEVSHHSDERQGKDGIQTGGAPFHTSDALKKTKILLVNFARVLRSRDREYRGEFYMHV